MNHTIKNGLRGWALGLLVSAPLVAAAFGANANELESIQAIPLGGDAVRIDLTLKEPPPAPHSFSVNQPARIAIDLPDTTPAAAVNSEDVGIGAVQKVVTASAQGRTRVVVELNYPAGYKTSVQGRHVYVTVGSGSAVAANSSFGPQSGGQAAGPAEASQIENIDFRRGANGAGRMLVRLSNPRTEADVNEQGHEVIVTFHNTQLPQNLMQRLDVTDFATPVDTIDATQHGDDTRIVIHTSGNYEQLAYQSDDRFAVEVKPVTQTAQTIANKQYTGKRLTLNFQDISVRAVLQLLADFTGLNMVVSDNVTGNITLRLHDVPWDQALDIILQTKGLAMRKHDNVVLIAPAQDIAAREKLQLEAQQQIQQLMPLKSAFIQVNYAKAADIASLLKSQQNSLLSKRGSVSVDARTNTLLVQDTEDRLADIRELVHKLDVPVRQVLIQSRIVIANNDFTRELGTRFGVTGLHTSQDGLISVTGNAQGEDAMINSAVGNRNSTGQFTPVALPPLNNRLAVNAPVAGPVGSLAFGILSSNYLVDLELSALQAEGRGEVVSSPRVVTANQKQALIQQGVQIPYQQASSSGATNTQFKNAVLKLQVTPQITPDNNIIMDLDVSKDSLGATLPSATGGSVPSIDTREVNTQVLVNNRDTVVLGGIYETTNTRNISKVPLLGDIPLLGFLFRNTKNVQNKDELLIFVTPKIVSANANLTATGSD
jgi:type IV pilus assembly protein PilQ